MGADEKLVAKEIGERVKVIRNRNNLTQRQVAEEVGWHHQELSRFESGRSDVRVSTLFKIARALGVSVEELVKEEQ